MSDEIRWAQRAAQALERVRAQKPLVHHITNQVVMNDTANVTLLLGALPVMAHSPQEVGEMAQGADALVLNLGTPTQEQLESMTLAGRIANEKGIPVIFDPVGVGATSFRDRGARQLLETLSITIVRGNRAEVGILAGRGGRVRGVEASEMGEAAESARSLAALYGLTAVATGKRDWASDGQRLLAVDNGHPLLTAVTGTGCMVTAIIGALAAVEPDPLAAAAAGLACFGVAAERAAEGASGPGSFKVALFDALYSLSPDQLAASAKIWQARGING